MNLPGLSFLSRLVQGYWLPTIRASLELNRGNAARAIELLEAAAPYELGGVPRVSPGTMIRSTFADKPI